MHHGIKILYSLCDQSAHLISNAKTSLYKIDQLYQEAKFTVSDAKPTQEIKCLKGLIGQWEIISQNSAKFITLIT